MVGLFDHISSKILKESLMWIMPGDRDFDIYDNIIFYSVASVGNRKRYTAQRQYKQLQSNIIVVLYTVVNT